VNQSSSADWLDHEHVVERDARIERLDWIQAHWPHAKHGFMLFGGWLSHALLEEAKYSFVHGQYIATALLAYSLIERILAAELYGIGRDDMERAASVALIRDAKELGLITPGESDLLNRLRQIRNPLVHFRRPLSAGTLEERWLAGGLVPYEQVEHDARQVLRALFRLLARHAS
jgi:hypothetical protein